MPTVPIYRYRCGIQEILCQVKVSPADFLRVQMYSWYQHKQTKQIFATYVGKRIYLQDVIKKEKGPWIHVNGDPLDYTSGNLVKSTTVIKTIKRKEGTAKIVGVCYVARRDRWKATISGKLIGYFKTEEEASAARLKKILTLNPMVKFVPEGTDPDGPSGMTNGIQYTVTGGKPDSYLDLDEVEETPLPPFPCESGLIIIKDSDYWKSIPPPSFQNS